MGVTLKNIDPSTTDDDDQDDEDEEFYEETLKKIQAPATANSGFDLNNTRSSTLTSSSSCSSAFSSMSNLNSTHDHKRDSSARPYDSKGMHPNEASPSVAIDLSKYLKDDEDDDLSEESESRNFSDAINESFDEYFTSPTKSKITTSKSFKPHEYIIE